MVNPKLLELAQCGGGFGGRSRYGGGGRGIRIVTNDKELHEGFETVTSESIAAVGKSAIIVEKFLEKTRHIEYQMCRDHHGNSVHLFERECSIQRRNQKVIEEAPSVLLTPEMRKSMQEQSASLAKAAGYHSAGTVEFMCDENNFYFLEMNTRLQVEHPVTEEAFGVDMVHSHIQ